MIGRRLNRSGSICLLVVVAFCCSTFVFPRISPLAAVAAVAPRRVLVTGGNKGIGKALCRQLAVDHGFYVLLGSRDEARGIAAVEDIVSRHPEVKDSIDFLSLDVTDAESVDAAAMADKYGSIPGPLYGIVNNAGIGFSKSMEETLEANTVGTQRVCDAFIPLLCPDNGRVVNTASASGPMFVNRCYGADKETADLLIDPEITLEQLSDLMQRVIANPGGKEPYGFSKACINAYTMYLAKQHPNLKINSMSPGFIDTDITRGMGASKGPEEGTKAAIHLLMGDLEGNGRYYGSDAVRSPMNRYRDPGDPPYTGP